MKTLLKTLLLTLLLAAGISAQVHVIAPDVTGSGKVTIPIVIKSGEDVTAFQFRLYFDRSVLQPNGYNFGCSVGDLIPHFYVVCNEMYPGELRVTGYSPGYFNGSGDIVNIDMYAGQGYSPLTLSHVFVFGWVDPIDVTWQDGSVTGY